MKKLLTSVAVATVLTTGASANKNIDLGYANVSINGVSKSGMSIGFGADFGETIKQKIAFKALILGKDNEADEDLGNIGDVYYDIGYEFYPNTIGYGSVGYGFMSIGSTGSGSNKTSIYAAGLTTGAGIKYNISDKFALDLAYKAYTLKYEQSNFDIKSTNLNLVYKFNN